MKPRSDLLVILVSFLFIFLFSYAAISKLIEYEKFRHELLGSPLLHDVAGIITWLVPAVELFIVLLLVKPELRRLGLYASVALMTLFTGYISWILVFSERIPCSCGGVLQSLTWHQHLVFNLVFIVMAFAAIVSLNRSIKLMRH